MTTDGQVLILHVLWKTVLSAKQCLLTKFWSSILCQQEECWLFNWLIKILFFYFPLVIFHWVLLCCWFSSTRISAQFIVGFSPLSSNIPLWKECKNPSFTDGELKQRQTLFSCSYTAYLNQNQTRALFPKVTLPASPRLLCNPIMGGIAMYRQLLILKSEQGLSFQWSSCPVLTLASARVCRRAEWGQLPSNLKKHSERILEAGLKYKTTQRTANTKRNVIKRCSTPSCCYIAL